jgi:hypothetical protein
MDPETRIRRCSSATTEAPVPAQTLAELLRDLGMVLRRRMRHWTGTGRASPPQPSLRWENKLALAFVNLRASVQLRAMVEDWPLHRIQEAIQAQQLETPGPREEYPTGVGPHLGAELENKRAGLPGFLSWLTACGLIAGLATGIIWGLR